MWTILLGGCKATFSDHT